MHTSRRKFLQIIGGGTILAATAPLAACGPAPTYRQPWAQAGTYSTPVKNALSYALLAPNPHNMQPWSVKLEESGCTLYVDRTRLLPHTDPFNRQITIGLGCFLELLVMAGAAQGYDVNLSLFPGGQSDDALDDRPIAHARFTPKADIQAPALFKHVLTRRSNKEPYDTSQPVDRQTLAQITRAARADVNVHSLNTDQDLKHVRDLTWQAWEIEYRTPRALGESIDVMRLGTDQINKNPDGIELTGAFMEAMIFTGILSKEAMRDPASTAFAQGLDMYRPVTETAMAYVMVRTKGNTRRHQIAAGRSWVRMNLAAAGQGVGLHPLSQIIQEYEEMAELYAQIHSAYAQPGETIQMLGRLGYAALPPATPRWPLDAKLI